MLVNWCQTMTGSPVELCMVFFFHLGIVIHFLVSIDTFPKNCIGYRANSCRLLKKETFVTWGQTVTQIGLVFLCALSWQCQEYLFFTRPYRLIREQYMRYLVFDPSDLCWPLKAKPGPSEVPYRTWTKPLHRTEWIKMGCILSAPFIDKGTVEGPYCCVIIYGTFSFTALMRSCNFSLKTYLPTPTVTARMKTNTGIYRSLGHNYRHTYRHICNSYIVNLNPSLPATYRQSPKVQHTDGSYAAWLQAVIKMPACR